MKKTESWSLGKGGVKKSPPSRRELELEGPFMPIIMKDIKTFDIVAGSLKGTGETEKRL